MATQWRKSTYSSNGTDCVEVAFTSLGVQLRHSQHPDGPVLHFTPDQWGRFLHEVITETLTNTNGAVAVETTAEGWEVREIGTNLTISFSRSEVNAFRLGAAAGEFLSSRSTVVAPGGSCATGAAVHR